MISFDPLNIDIEVQPSELADAHDNIRTVDLNLRPWTLELGMGRHYSTADTL